MMNRVFSIAKAENELGYKPEVELDEGIKETIRWYIESKLL